MAYHASGINDFELTILTYFFLSDEFVGITFGFIGGDAK